MNMQTLLFTGFSLILFCVSRCDPIPTVPLYNAAQPNTFMPLVGLGTGGYSAAKSPQATPEHWNATEGFINTLKWFSLNGTSWDTALSYDSLPGVAKGLLNATNHWTTTNRKDIWITTKIGMGGPMGYDDTLKEFEQLSALFDTSYFDLILMHWPSDNTSMSYKSTDVYCNADATNNLYDPTTCRQHTWKAMEWIFNHSGARAIGVSNFEVRHLEDIFNLNSLIPAVNQFEFHGYWHEHDLVEYCQSYKIGVNSYAPLGTPDVMEGYWKPVLTQHPVATAIGNKYHKSAAQVWLRWAVQQGIVVNPRSWNIAHQHQNMQIFDFELDQNEMLSLASIRAPSDNKICPDPHYWQ